MNILSLLSLLNNKNTKLSAAVIAILLLGAAFWRLNTEIDELETKNSALTEKIEIITAEKERIESALDNQTRAVEYYKEQSKNLADEIAIMLKRYNQSVVEHSLELEALRKKHSPKDCNPAMDWMVERAEEDLQW